MVKRRFLVCVFVHWFLSDHVYCHGSKLWFVLCRTGRPVEGVLLDLLWDSFLSVALSAYGGHTLQIYSTKAMDTHAACCRAMSTH